MLLHLHLPHLSLPFLLKLSHFALLGDHGRPLIYVSPCIQRQVADDRGIVVDRLVLLIGVVDGVWGVAPEVLVSQLWVVELQVRVQDLVAVRGRDKAWRADLFLAEGSYL